MVMHAFGAQLPAEDRVVSRFGSSFYVVIGIFAVCLSAFVYASLFLSGTLLGFSVGFASGVIAIECVVVVRRQRQNPPNMTNAWRVR
jgi:hypothetical protein